MARNFRRAPSPTIPETAIEPEARAAIDSLLRLLATTGPKVQRYILGTTSSKCADDPRPMLFLRIVARRRANASGVEGSPGFYGDIPRWQLATYLDHVPAIVRALENFVVAGGIFGLCDELGSRGLSAVETRVGESGAGLRFPGSGIPDLFVGARRDDIAEAILVMLSHDDPRGGVEAVRRLR